MATSLIKLPFDKTGKAPANLVPPEQHTLVNRPVRAVVPDYGAFFAKSLIVRDEANGRLLVRGQHYQLAEFYSILTDMYGDQIWAAILIIDPTVSNSVTVSYQALGGEYSYSQKAIKARYEELMNSGAVIEYNDLIDIPKGFIPRHHLHDGRDVKVGWEFFINRLNSITGSLAIGDRHSHDAIYNFINQAIGDASDDASVVVDSLIGEHVGSANPHPQYARQSDIGASIAAVRRPRNVFPAAAQVSVAPNTRFDGSTYYTFYGITQKAAQFQVSTNANFSTIVIDGTANGAVTTYQPSTLLQPNTTYFWRVRYQDVENMWSEWSTVTSFSTSTIAIGRPSITSPANGSETQTETPTFISNAFVVSGGTDTHAASDWELWTGPKGTGTKAYSVGNDTTNKTKITIPPAALAQNTTYYVRVRYRGSNYGYSDWSDDVMVKSVWPLRPTVPGQAFQGGFYGGDVTFGGSTYAIVVAPKSVGETSMPLYSNTGQTGNGSFYDSVANNEALAGGAGAAQWAKALRIGGFSDWVVPAAYPLNALWQNLRPTGDNTPAAFKSGGTEAFAQDYYWSSSAYDWTETIIGSPTPIYANVNHVDCSNSASAWYGPNNSAAPPAVCAQGTVSNYRVSYAFGTNPSTGQAGSLNTSTWCCNWQAYEVVGYEPGQTTYVNHWEARTQFFGQLDRWVGFEKIAIRPVRAVRMVKVA